MQIFHQGSFLEGLTKVLKQSLYRAIKIAQYFLILVFYTLLTTFSYLYLTSLSKLQKQPFQMIIWLIVGVWIQFNMLFNYTMCVIVKAGNPNDIHNSHISHIQYKCKKCNSIKPPRTHHCSMCQQCILQMDHHCPWIGRCVGHHNRAYFLNFLTYTLFGLFIMRQILSDYMQRPIYRLQIYQNKVDPGMMFQSYVFVYTLLFVLGLFSLFHWYLALYGKSTLQFCFDDPRYTPSKSYLTNLQIIFGTTNLFYIFMPKLSVLKMQGFQWQGNEQAQNTTAIQIQALNFPKK